MRFSVQKKVLLALFALMAMLFAESVGAQQIGQINGTGMSCRLDLPVCNGDTILLVPTNTVNYTNFKWYYGSVTGANEITGPNPAQGAVSVSNDSLIAVAPGGMYIMTGEYTTPAGCSAINDTIVLDFQPVPSLATVPDTICSAAFGGQSTDLASLVTDANNVSGTTSWFATLGDAQNNTGALANTVVSPTATTTYYVRKTSSGTAGCFDIDSVQIVVSCLALGNQVFYDTDNSGGKNGAEAGIPNVTVQLFLDANADGSLTGLEQTPIATDVTDGSGLYLFENLKEGKYFVGIPANQFSAGAALESLFSSQTTRADDGTIAETAANSANSNNSDTDDNGTKQTGGFFDNGILTDQIMLMYLTEPTGENPDNSATTVDNNDNQTADFGFYGMSVGSQVFMDVNNNGLFESGTEMPLGGVTIKLYSKDGTTVIATTVTGADGRYLFTNLPEGDYIVAVDGTSAPLTGKQKSDPIASTTTPNSDDNDSNGSSLIGTEIWSNVFTLDAGAAPTGESDQAQTTGAGMGQTPQKDNPLTPDANSNLYVDFGFKSDCPTITNPSADQTICADEAGGTSGSAISVSTNVTTPTQIRFVKFGTPQAGSAMYTGGTDLGTVAPSAGTATLPFSIADFPNTTAAPITYYVYAVMEPASADVTCRPFQVISVTVNPRPAASPATLTLCETTPGGGSAEFTLAPADATVLGGQTGMTLTYHATLSDAQNDANPITTTTATNGNTVFARVETANGCYRTSTITLNVNAAPDFTLSLPTVCPGDAAVVKINNLTGADPFTAEYKVNSGSFSPYSALTNATLTTAEGIVLGTSNMVTIRNVLVPACSTTKSITPPNTTPKVCLPLKVVKL